MNDPIKAHRLRPAVSVPRMMLLDLEYLSRLAESLVRHRLALHVIFIELKKVTPSHDRKIKLIDNILSELVLTLSKDIQDIGGCLEKVTGEGEI